MISGEIEKAVNSALNYLGYRSRSINETKNYLKKKGYDEKIIKEAICYLEDKEYLDDLCFTKMWIRIRKENHLLGKCRIKSELLLKGIDVDLIDEELDVLYSEEEENEKALEAARKQLKKYGEVEDEKKLQRLYRFLVNKGFRPEISRKTCKIFFDF